VGVDVSLPGHFLDGGQLAAHGFIGGIEEVAGKSQAEFVAVELRRRLALAYGGNAVGKRPVRQLTEE
jgi:hypothetical protein